MWGDQSGETEAGHGGEQERDHCHCRGQGCEAGAAGLQTGLDSRQTVQIVNRVVGRQDVRGEQSHLGNRMMLFYFIHA